MDLEPLLGSRLHVLLLCVSKIKGERQVLSVSATSTVTGAPSGPTLPGSFNLPLVFSFTALTGKPN